MFGRFYPLKMLACGGFHCKHQQITKQKADTSNSGFVEKSQNHLKQANQIKALLPAPSVHQRNKSVEGGKS